MVTGLDTGYALADRLDDTSSFMPKNAGEETFRVLSIKGVDVSVTQRICDDLQDGNVLEDQRDSSTRS